MKYTGTNETWLQVFDGIYERAAERDRLCAEMLENPMPEGNPIPQLLLNGKTSHGLPCAVQLFSCRPLIGDLYM
jgi:hypothetical protein